MGSCEMQLRAVRLSGNFVIIVFKSIACSEWLEVQRIHHRPSTIDFLTAFLPVFCVFVRCLRLLLLLLLTAVRLVAAQLAVHRSVAEHRVVLADVFAWHIGFRIRGILPVTVVIGGIVVGIRPADAKLNCRHGRVGSIRRRWLVISRMFWMSN